MNKELIVIDRQVLKQMISDCKNYKRITDPQTDFLMGRFNKTLIETLTHILEISKPLTPFISEVFHDSRSITIDKNCETGEIHKTLDYKTLEDYLTNKQF